MKREELLEYFELYQEDKRQFLEATRYVFVDKKCNDAYSFANLLVSICGDFETLIKKEAGKEGQKLNIAQMIKFLKEDELYSKVFEQKVYVKNYDEFIPLKICDDEKTFSWWSAYNKIKHNKLKSLSEANLLNVINALAGLYVLNKYILSKISMADGCVDVFEGDNKYFKLVDFKEKYSSSGIAFKLEGTSLYVESFDK